MAQIDNISLIQSFLKKKKISVSNLIKDMGIGRNTFYYQLNKEVPSYDFIKKFNEVTGSDILFILNIQSSAIPVLKNQSNARTIGDINYPLDPDETPFIPIGDGQYVMLVPLVNEYSYAGYLAGYRDPEYIEDLPKHTIVVGKQHRGTYQAFENIGDSMENYTSEEMAKESIPNGSIVTGRQIKRELWTSKLHTHKWKDFVIVHKDGIITKRIIKHDVNKGIIIAHSLNPDKITYPDREIFLDDVYQIFNVVNVSNSR